MSKLVPESHTALHIISEEVTPEEFTDGTVKKILKGMRAAIKTYEVDGFIAVAIAAPQIGVAKRIFLVEDQTQKKSEDEEDRLPTLVAINPRIIKTSKKTHLVGEGCLSVKDRYGTVRRATNVTFEALDENGEKYTRGAGGLLAQIIQHEYNHLDGILFVDVAEKVWEKKDNEPTNEENDAE
ncbi:MAG: peptide deformylase [Candidatus Nomurabacteria bacterium]|nr:peptide deformylase [Candidatus Nomurabacteria bacterium]USN87985.1 MAG: peptide deformylase [Candidatus Nomurabacteria bacterium]